MNKIGIKYRVQDEYVIATVWSGGIQYMEIGRVSVDLIGPADGELYETWMGFMRLLLNTVCVQATGTSLTFTPVSDSDPPF